MKEPVKLSFAVPWILSHQFELWCRLDNIKSEQRLAEVLFKAMATDDMGRAHLEAVGPIDRAWRKLAAQSGWRMTEQGKVRRTRK